MLIFFRFENFRSFQEQAELSLVAHRADKTLLDTLIEPKLSKRSELKLVPSVAIYGANAAGKSNVLLALDYMRDAVVYSQAVWKPGGGTMLSPCAMQSNRRRSSSFEVDIAINSVRYNYGFVVNRSHFEQEWLLSFPLGRERTLFRRSTIQSGENFVTSIDFGDSLIGERRDFESMERRTRENSLFLSAAAQDNQSDARTIFNWFENNLTILASPLSEFEGHETMMVSEMALEHPDLRQRLLLFLRAADPAIHDLEITERHFEPSSFEAFKGFPPEVQDFLRKGFRYNIDVVLGDGGERFKLPLSGESRGVRRIYALAGRIIFALNRGEVLVLDELEASMHPNLARFLIDLFAGEMNKNGAQFIFTTHDTNLLDQSLLRRDQIWFVEKAGCCSHLYPLLDFSPRKDENLETGYLRGRYGAIPVLSMTSSWFPSGAEINAAQK